MDVTLVDAAIIMAVIMEITTTVPAIATAPVTAMETTTITTITVTAVVAITIIATAAATITATVAATATAAIMEIMLEIQIVLAAAAGNALKCADGIARTARMGTAAVETTAAVQDLTMALAVTSVLAARIRGSQCQSPEMRTADVDYPLPA